MNNQINKTYPYHLSFLSDFPELTSWLNCHGFTIMHSHQDFKMQIIYTFWADYTSETDTTGINDAQYYLVLAYCQKFKTVEVYRRAVITKQMHEKQVVMELEKMFGDNPIEPSDSYTPEKLNQEIDDLLDDLDDNNNKLK
jgi:hypothetical protein